jgi:hypothetical protein
VATAPGHFQETLFHQFPEYFSAFVSWICPVSMDFLFSFYDFTDFSDQKFFPGKVYRVKLFRYKYTFKYA